TGFKSTTYALSLGALRLPGYAALWSLIVNLVVAVLATLVLGALGASRGGSVGRSLVLDRIGAGGMGSVYAAYDPELDRRIALKTLHTTRSDGRPMDQKALVREAKAMARLSHPNVVTVHDVLEFGDQVLLAMELVEGESLRAWLDRQPRSDREILE